MFFLPALVASLGMAQAAVVTVTQHVHEDAIVSVEGVLYVENGQTQTTFITQGAATPTSISNKISSTVIALAGASGSSVNTANLQSAMNYAAASSSAPSPSSTSVAAETASTSGSQTTLAPSSSSVVVTTISSSSPAAAQSSSTAAPSSSTAAQSSSTAAPSSSSAPSSTSSSASASASSTSSDFQSTMVDGHNDKRAKHESTGSLEWDDSLAQYAQNYADKYDCSGSLTHSGGPYGENLAVGYTSQGTIDAWYNEIEKYNWSDPGFSESTGHFTQVVWKSTTKVGCGSKQCGGSVGTYIICSYNPAGNFIGDFSENVLPLSS
ncbi:ZYBA0S03-05248g1_1 [Zygosaccharomyces bailii CLIB 213]|uniref:ZYBA0S03-05248g1_1 n=1 Tax=Zygosaccharomyces bailii (strain CLIB 213 / ATCC 58445 / CBS 680 / BCRC 21525 / NBRC 1098 / NCYC 1416 / NRRL Y-2227) TaxID=1333698 RepID=A0A8J2T4G8_ZYGB2|nr:ZYBA0S03-05248g1_1 [Zygosaccharomyces bailii CLIB 213]